MLLLPHLIAYQQRTWRNKINSKNHENIHFWKFKRTAIILSNNNFSFLFPLLYSFILLVLRMEIDSIDCSQFRDFYSVVRQLIDNGFLQNDFSVLQSQFYRIRNSYINNDFKHPEIKEYARHLFATNSCSILFHFSISRIDVSVGSLAGGLMANGMTQEDVDMIRRIEKDLRVPSSCCVPYFICSLDPEYKRLVGMSNSMDRVQITEKLYYLEYYYMFLSLNLLITVCIPLPTPFLELSRAKEREPQLSPPIQFHQKGIHYFLWRRIE